MTSSIDPNTNFRAPSFTCDYYDETEFSNAFNASARSKLKLLHINARSLPKNIDSIINCVNALENTFSVMGISETWLRDIEDPLVQIEKYSLEGFCRENKRGGGVASFTKHDIIYKTRQDISVNNLDIESCYIELLNNNSKMVVVVVGKSPSVSFNVL